MGFVRAALIESEHMEKIVQDLEQHSVLPLAFECAAGIDHGVHTSECSCNQGIAACSTVHTGASAGTAQLFELGEQLLDLDLDQELYVELLQVSLEFAVDTSECRGNAAGSSVHTGPAAGTARLF